MEDKCKDCAFKDFCPGGSYCTKGNRFIGEIDEDDYYALSIQLKKGIIPEVTFENSPQMVELK